MKIIITGASGFIGKQLISSLVDQGYFLLLVGRDPSQLEAFKSKSVSVAGYSEIPEKANEFDAIIHLAAKNNDQAGSIEEFRSANVELLKEVVSASYAANVKMFINISSLRASSKTSQNPYDVSKAEAEAWLQTVEYIKIVNIRLPAVYGDNFRGNLAVLNKTPKFLHAILLNTLKCIKPAVHLDLLSNELSKIIQNPPKESSDLFVTDRQMGNPIYSFMVRLLDLSFAFVVLIGFWWLLAIIWLAVKLTSPGPGVFAQPRVGIGGNVFTCYKFRTMADGTVQAGTHEISKAHVTKVGSLLRKLKLDELPQLINIIRNEVSLVGPRPGLPAQRLLIEERTKRRVLEVKPGITGWSQINGIDMSDPARLAQMDSQYVYLRTLLFDLKIIIYTAIGYGRGDNVS
ncbi:MAG: hybrid nucleoside-diphosphate sugar epimerase/sugar transferase [Pseudomonadota bacterium]